MNKEKLIAELVCLLEVTSREQDVADFKQEIESYVIAGAARIDLIAKIIDLDNEIGGYNFDIPLLKDTEQTIKEAGKPAGRFAPISTGMFSSVFSVYFSSY